MRRSLLTLCLAFLTASAWADAVLINDVRIFNGVDTKLTVGNVLVVDGVIETISDEAIAAPEGATVIAGNNRILTPGFIDLHVHLTMHTLRGSGGEHATAVGARTVAAAQFFLDHGFTTVRDAGGTHPDLARAFNSGQLYGPRVFPSGAIVMTRTRPMPAPARTSLRITRYSLTASTRRWLQCAKTSRTAQRRSRSWAAAA